MEPEQESAEYVGFALRHIDGEKSTVRVRNQLGETVFEMKIVDDHSIAIRTAYCTKGFDGKIYEEPMIILSKSPSF